MSELYIYSLMAGGDESHWLFEACDNSVVCVWEVWYGLILDDEEFIFDAGGGHVTEAGRTVQQGMLYDAFV